MSAKDDLTIPLIPERYYHIFNRGINRCHIYFKPENYNYFLRKYSEKLTGYFDTFGYCLLSNHFHLMIRVKSQEAIFEKASLDFDCVNETFYKDYVLPWLARIGIAASDLDGQDLTNFKNLFNLALTYGDTQQETQDQLYDLDDADFCTQLALWVVSERFRGFLLGYAKAVNKQESRTGSLFQKGFRRKYIGEDAYNLKTALMYVHHNPIHHFCSKTYEDYTWSSYNAYINDKPTQICKVEGLTWFYGEKGFREFGEKYKVDKSVKSVKFDWMIDENQ